jgi:hypothetical protein
MPVKKKDNFLVQAVKAYKGSRDIAPLIFTFGARWR